MRRIEPRVEFRKACACPTATASGPRPVCYRRNPDGSIDHKSYGTEKIVDERPLFCQRFPLACDFCHMPWTEIPPNGAGGPFIADRRVEA